MSKNYQEKLVGVFGDPVDENPSVVIEQAAFDACNQPFRYLTIQVKDGDLEKAMTGLRAMNFSGINITMPHKLEVLKYLDEIAEDAQIMGAVNTVYWKDGKLRGENTDGKGFMRSLKDGEVEVSGKKAVILGAGGVARAITVELARAGIAKLTVLNIIGEQGEALVELLNTKAGTNAEFVLWNGAYSVPSDTDILVNATSIGFADPTQRPNIDYSTVLPSMVVCDVIPNSTHTLFLDAAAEKGCKTFNGLQMLVNQGALAFEFWTGQDAPVEVMVDALCKEYNQDS